jgi:hypothetical protein
VLSIFLVRIRRLPTVGVTIVVIATIMHIVKAKDFFPGTALASKQAFLCYLNLAIALHSDVLWFFVTIVSTHVGRLRIHRRLVYITGNRTSFLIIYLYCRRTWTVGAPDLCQVFQTLGVRNMAFCYFQEGILRGSYEVVDFKRLENLEKIRLTNGPTTLPIENKKIDPHSL